ncbi:MULTISPECIES: HAD family hydrolase [Streptomyces]|uniref:HAD family hydrolase n=1 Tax=Streptomyces TaxID=1883 RepID=UPI00099E6581|nr:MULTISPECIES: HAD family hydrolase [Streptomyces]
MQTAHEAPQERRIRHVVWDWNGTLLDDNHVMLASVNDVCAHFGRPAVDMPAWRAALRRPLWLCYGTILDRDVSGAEEWAEVVRLYRAGYHGRADELRLAADAEKTLARVREAGLTQSVLSMALHDDVTTQATRFGVHRYVERIDGVLPEAAGGHKAGHLADHIGRLGLAPDECLLVGDVVDDAAAARQAGVRCVLVTTGMTAADELHETGLPVAGSLAEAFETGFAGA